MTASTAAREGARTALVTGAARGIGRACAARLAADGHRVVATWHRAEPTRDIEGVRWVQVDLEDAARVDALVRDIGAQEGQIDILVANAGMVRDRAILRSTDADFAEVLDVNLRAQFTLCRAVLGPMAQRRWGRIVLISSVGAFTANSGQAAYAASKLGLVALARVVAREFGARGVTANVVAPGMIDTELMRTFPPAWSARWLETVPMGRMGTAEEVASAVRFLVGESAGFITGAVLPVDGGFLAGFGLREPAEPS